MGGEGIVQEDVLCQDMTIVKWLINQGCYNYIMRLLLSALLVISSMYFCSYAADPQWSSIPSMRAGQIDSVTNLMTAEDTSTTITDIAITYNSPFGSTSTAANLQYGLSLISFESWMTDTFSFNITMASITTTGATIRYTVLDNTFFTMAKVHYLVIWRASSDIVPGAQPRYNMEVIYGCYLTEMLLTNTNRTQKVGGIQTSSLAQQGLPTSRLQIRSMISGLKLSNTVGNNNYVKITPTISSNKLDYQVDVQINNFLTFFCVSTVIAEPAYNKITYMFNLEYGTYTLNATNAGLTVVPYSLRYDGTDRMFFGISEFNLSMSDTRYLSVETTNISLVSSQYSVNAALNQITYHAFYFAARNCPSTFYEPVSYTCVTNGTCPSTSFPDVTYTVCVPCHYSCDTCTLGSSQYKCLNCPNNLTTLRYKVTNTTGTMCLCIDGYADAGEQVCRPCSTYLVGCLKCSTTTFCDLCNPTDYYNVTNLTLTTSTCLCKPPKYMTSGFCLSYSGCLIAGWYNNIIACQVCDASKNFIPVTTDFSCTCNLGYVLNATNANKTCDDICGDNITAFGKCDDGNFNAGDGCDNCTVENGWHCGNVTNITGRSDCVLKQDLTISYLYAERHIGTNSFKMAFQISPTQNGLTTDSFDKNFNTSLPIASQKISCDPATNIIYLQGVYLQDLQGTSQTAWIAFQNMTFYADAQTIYFTAVGINAQLVMDEYASSNLILQYIIMAEAFTALIVTIFASVVGLKLVGMELLIPLQLIYFSLSTLSQQRSYNFALNNLKYANGFNTLVPYSYARTYSQRKSLVGMNYETEFLLSTNIMLGAFIAVLLWLLVHHLRLKYKYYKLETFLEKNALNEPLPEKENSVDSEEDREDAEHDEQKMKLRKKKRINPNTQLQKKESRLREDHHRSFKVFSFEVDRLYFIFYLILFNQMMFGFIIMTLNVPISAFYFPQEINVLACNFIFFIYIGNIVFISYDQESNKMIAFTCIKDRYAYIYILIDIIVITTLSMSFQQSSSGYMVAALTVAFPLLVLKERPYGSEFLGLENIVALYLQIMLVVCEIIVCLIESSNNEKTSLIYTFIIMVLIAIGQILTIIRVAVKVNFKKAFDDLKNPHKDDDAVKNKKVIQKNLDLLEEDKNISIIPPESVKNDLIPKNKMVDWQSKNTEQYESVRQRQFDDQGEVEGNQVDHQDEASQNKEEKLNELQILKKRLRNNLKLKKEQDMLKKGI